MVKYNYYVDVSWTAEKEKWLDDNAIEWNYLTRTSLHESWTRFYFVDKDDSIKFKLIFG